MMGFGLAKFSRRRLPSQVTVGGPERCVARGTAKYGHIPPFGNLNGAADETQSRRFTTTMLVRTWLCARIMNGQILW